MNSALRSISNKQTKSSKTLIGYENLKRKEVVEIRYVHF